MLTGLTETAVKAKSGKGANLREVTGHNLTAQFFAECATAKPALPTGLYFHAEVLQEVFDVDSEAVAFEVSRVDYLRDCGASQFRFSGNARSGALYALTGDGEFIGATGHRILSSFHSERFNRILQMENAITTPTIAEKIDNGV